MSWFGKLTFGSLGLFFGGPLGAIAGAALGHHFIDKNIAEGRKTVELENREKAQASYFVCIFSILGKLAKADGHVSRNEIAVVEEFISHMKMHEREVEFAKKVFREAKNSTYSIDEFARQFYQTARTQPAVLMSFMDVLFKLAVADGELHEAEELALKRIKNIFNLNDQQYNSIKAVHFKDTEKYYKVLNCTSASSEEEIKKNYKKLVKEFHPDTIISKGLPEEFVKFATERFQEIQYAYDVVRKERRL